MLDVLLQYEGWRLLHSLDVLYGGLRISKLQFLIKKYNFFSIVFFLNFWSSKPWISIRIRIHFKCLIRIRIHNEINYLRCRRLPCDMICRQAARFSTGKSGRPRAALSSVNSVWLNREGREAFRQRGLNDLDKIGIFILLSRHSEIAKIFHNIFVLNTLRKLWRCSLLLTSTYIMNVWHFQHLYAFVISKDCIVTNPFIHSRTWHHPITKNTGVIFNT